MELLIPLRNVAKQISDTTVNTLSLLPITSSSYHYWPKELKVLFWLNSLSIVCLERGCGQKYIKPMSENFTRTQTCPFYNKGVSFPPVSRWWPNYFMRCGSIVFNLTGREISDIDLIWHRHHLFWPCFPPSWNVAGAYLPMSPRLHRILTVIKQ